MAKASSLSKFLSKSKNFLKDNKLPLATGAASIGAIAALKDDFDPRDSAKPTGAGHKKKKRSYLED